MLTRIAVLVSGGGTNLQALLDAQGAGKLLHGQIVLVVSDVPGAYALQRAEGAGVPALTLPRRQLGNEEFERQLSGLLGEHQVDMIVLAGFLGILSGEFTARWPRRILNIHPSLIPSFCGRGMYGLKVHRAALEAAQVRGISHITGGGFYENIPRAIPDGLCAKIEKAAIHTPAIFGLLQRMGSIPEHDMFNTYNMGVGMTMVVSRDTADAALSALRAGGCNAYAVGEIVTGQEKVVLC